MKISKTSKTFFIDDGADRGPLTMVRVRFHPHRPLLYNASTAASPCGISTPNL